MDCYNRCLCAICANNDTCKDGCEMCQSLKVCRFIIGRGKCKAYKPNEQLIQEAAIAHARAQQEVNTNANTDGSSGG